MILFLLLLYIGVLSSSLYLSSTGDKEDNNITYSDFPSAADRCYFPEARRPRVLDWQRRAVSPCPCMLLALFVHFTGLSSIMRIFRSPTVKCYSSWWALWSAQLRKFLWRLLVLFQKISQEKNDFKLRHQRKNNAHGPINAFTNMVCPHSSFFYPDLHG